MRFADDSSRPRAVAVAVLLALLCAGLLATLWITTAATRGWERSLAAFEAQRGQRVFDGFVVQPLDPTLPARAGSELSSTLVLFVGPDCPPCASGLAALESAEPALPLVLIDIARSPRPESLRRHTPPHRLEGGQRLAGIPVGRLALPLLLALDGEGRVLDVQVGYAAAGWRRVVRALEQQRADRPQ